MVLRVSARRVGGFYPGDALAASGSSRVFQNGRDGWDVQQRYTAQRGIGPRMTTIESSGRLGRAGRTVERHEVGIGCGERARAWLIRLGGGPLTLTGIETSRRDGAMGWAERT